MEVREWYKLTELGVVPEDWEVHSLGDCCSKIGSGITPTGGEKVYKTEGRPFIRSQNVGWGNLDLHDIAFIDDEIHSSFDSTEVKEDDVFLNITGASIGRSAIADRRVAGGNVNQHVCIIRTENRKLVSKFLNHFLLSINGQKQVDSFQGGGNRQGLNFGQIRAFKIPFPPSKAEQTAIATALSDTDALIQSLEKLIAKKQAIKQGSMQLLLTGKQRLAGFSGEWEVKRLGEIFFIAAGGDLLEKFYADYQDEEHRYPIYSNSVFDKGLYGFSKVGRHKKDSITITARGSIGFANYRDHDFDAIGRVLVLCPAIKLNGFFVAEYINTQIEFSVESTGVPQLTAPQIAQYEVILPPSVKEQNAIAEVLLEMDNELQALEQKRSKYRQIKQGMMQELLTGKTRLV